MAFSDEVVKDGRGVLYLIEISLDAFATISYRYATHFGSNAGGDFDPRLTSVGALPRAFGQRNAMQTTSVDIVLANEDGGADWLVDQSTTISVLKARIKLWIGLYDPATFTTPIASIAYKQLGEYVISDFPRRDNTSIQFTMVDNSFGIFDQTVDSPTLADWYAADTSATTNPMFAGTSFIFAANKNTPLQIAFGENPVSCFYAGRQVNTPLAGAFFWTICFPICVTTLTSAVASSDIASVYAEIEYPTSGLKFAGQIPRTIVVAGATKTVWSRYKSNTITKGGKNWKILWVGFDVRYLSEVLFSAWRATYGEPLVTTASEAPGGSLLLSGYWFKRCMVTGFPLSARTNTSTLQQHPADVISDLISYYSVADSSKVDATTFARVRTATASLAVGGTVGPIDAESAKTISTAMSEIAESSDIDVFMKTDGTVGLSCRNLDFTSQTATLSSLDEARVYNPSEEIPSRDKRGAPFNQIVLAGKTETLVGESINTGPFDDPAGTVASWTRAISREFATYWVPEPRLQFQSPWTYRNVDGAPRPVLRVTTDLQALNFELGDFIQVSWTRGLLGTPHGPSIFQIQELSLDPGRGQVELSLLWFQDLRTNRPYLLDDETLLDRVASGGGRTATVTDSSTTVLFSSGSLVTDAVAVGDHLILRDATEAATAFKRNRALKITAITDATHLVIADASLDFGTVGGTAVATWEIRKSHLTYPTVADVANYPEGANMYGRVSSVASGGVFSAAGTGGFTGGHVLLDG